MTDPVGGQPIEDEPMAAQPETPQSGTAQSGTAEPPDPAAVEPASGPTGHPVVDAAVAGLAEQADLPPAEQVAGYEAAQRALHQTLASIDQT